MLQDLSACRLTLLLALIGLEILPLRKKETVSLGDGATRHQRREFQFRRDILEYLSVDLNCLSLRISSEKVHPRRDFFAMRRSTRRRSSPVKNFQEDSSTASSSDGDSDARDDAFKAPSAKRTKVKGPAIRASKKSKTSKTVTKETEEINEDDENREENFLYEAIMDPETSIDNLVNDFLDSYNEDPIESMRDLINMVLRCSGAKLEITTYDVEDADTIPETLTQLQDHLTGKDTDVVKVALDTYPLVSRNKIFKGFRKQIADFWSRLITHAADKQLLYDDGSGTLFPTIESWLVSMSSSSLRAFRHTATNICLSIMTCMVEVSATQLKDLEVANRQLAAEENKTKPAAGKLKTLQKTIETKTNQNEKLSEMISNYFDAVFVHRYRDIDSKIRSESIKELGIWMMKLPGTFFEGQYLRYLGWVLSDPHGSTRLEVIRALTKLYGYDEYIGGLRHFTERFKPRMIEIALQDIEVNIRCAAFALLERVRQRGFLEDEDTNLIIGSIFDDEEKVRLAVGTTLRSVLQDRETEMIEEQLGGDITDHGDLDSSWITLKTVVSTISKLTSLLVQADKASNRQLNLARLAAGLSPGRVRLAALSFLNDFADTAFDDIAAYLLYDNDAAEEPTSADPAEILKSVLSMSPNEERILLELLVASAELAGIEAEKTAKKAGEPSIVAESIMSILPKLLARFTDAHMLSISLQLLTVCDLSIYSKLRKTTQFEGLLDTITKIFFGYQEESLLRDIGCVLIVVSKEDTLNTIVKDKILDLQESARSVFLELGANDDSLITTIRRLSIISSVDDCALSFEEASGQQSSIYSKLKDLLASGTETVRSSSRTCIRNYFMWKIKQLTETRFGLELKEVEDLISRRDDVLFVLDAQVEEGDEGATSTVVELENIFAHLNVIEVYDGLSTRRALDVNLQKALIKLFQKAAKHYGRLHNRNVILEGDVTSEDEDNESDNEDDDLLSKKIDSERRLCVLAGEIVSSLAAEKMDSKYTGMLFANKGKLGPSFDMILKEIDQGPMTKKLNGRPKAKATSLMQAEKARIAQDDASMAEIDDIED